MIQSDKTSRLIPYGRQHITDEDIAAVVKILKSDFLTQGKTTPDFESALSDYTGSQHAITTNSGTSALHLSCLSLGLKKGDWLWTSPISFVASANCGLYCDAKVDFVDINSTTWNIDTNKLKSKLEIAKRNHKLPKIIVVVHLAGTSCDMEKIFQLSKEYGFLIIEDACHAIGGRYKNNIIGNCQYSDITVFSFHPVKNITTGEGGAALTNNHEIAKKIKLLRGHGIVRDTNKTNMPHWHYEQVELGFNYRMTDIQAALGISQLNRLDDYVSKRNNIANIYNKRLSHLPLQLPYVNENYYSAMHLYIVRIKLNKVTKSHQEIFDFLRSKNIGVNLHYIPIYRQPYYKAMGFNNNDFPESESYYAEAISLPIFPILNKTDQEYIIETLEDALL